MSKGKVLVVMSSANALDLEDGKTYPTGYYLNAFVVPYRELAWPPSSTSTSGTKSKMV